MVGKFAGSESFRAAFELFFESFFLRTLRCFVRDELRICFFLCSSMETKSSELMKANAGGKKQCKQLNPRLECRTEDSNQFQLIPFGVFVDTPSRPSRACN